MRKQNGITLIALVITIVVLLILAGVSISMVLGDNSILSKAKSAKTQTNDATIKEYISNALVSTDAEYLVNGTGTEKAWYEGTGSTFFGNEVKKSGASAGTITTYTAATESAPLTVIGTMTMNSKTYNWTATNGSISVTVTE